MNVEISECPICCSPLYEPVYELNKNNLICSRCGRYGLTEEVHYEKGLASLNKVQRANLSGWIREHQSEVIDKENLKRLQFINTPTVHEKAIKLLKYFSNQFPVAGNRISFDINILPDVLDDVSKNALNGLMSEKIPEYLPLLSISWTQNFREFYFIFVTYLIETKHYITSHKNPMISPEGWAFLDSLKYGNPDSQMAFIAMWFDPSMNPVLEQIEKAVLDSGYEPKRVDKHEHVNRIDDEIIALIRQSKFIVADYTGQRGGVYFESGFALGLNLPVIWICRKDEEKKLHFDTSHFNFIFWEDTKLSELKEALQRRIIAIMGKGSYKPNNTDRMLSI